jgi:hypothetical protein
MANRMVIKESSVTASQLADLFRQISEGSITGEMVQAFNERRNPFEQLNLSGKVLQEWKRFYKENFGIELPNGIKIPAKKEGFNRLLIIAEGLTNNLVYEACQKHFTCYRYNDDLDTAVPTSERNSQNGSYAIWVRDEVEADEVHANKSAEMVKFEGTTTETLLERILHELVYFLETKRHLDLYSVTLCSASRLSCGDVPGASWRGSEFVVCKGEAGNRGARIRPREVIS